MIKVIEMNGFFTVTIDNIKSGSVVTKLWETLSLLKSRNEQDLIAEIKKHTDDFYLSNGSHFRESFDFFFNVDIENSIFYKNIANGEARARCDYAEVKRRVRAFYRIPGARTGDFVETEKGNFRHIGKTERDVLHLQMNDKPIYLAHGGFCTSELGKYGSLTTYRQSGLKHTGLMLGKVWLYSGDNAVAYNRVWAYIPFRIYEVKK